MGNNTDAVGDGLTGWTITGSNSHGTRRFPDPTAVPQMQHRQNLNETPQSPHARRVTSGLSSSWRPRARNAATATATDQSHADLSITPDSSPPAQRPATSAVDTSANELDSPAAPISPPVSCPTQNPTLLSSSGGATAATVGFFARSSNSSSTREAENRGRVGESSEFFSTLAQKQQAMQRQNAHKANVSERGRRWLQQRHIRQRQRQRFLQSSFEVDNGRMHGDSSRSGVGRVLSAPLVPVEWRRAGTGSGRVALGAGHIEGDGYSDGFVDGYGYGDARDYITSAAGVRKRVSVEARGRGAGRGTRGAAAAAATAVVAAQRLVSRSQTPVKDGVAGQARARVVPVLGTSTLDALPSEPAPAPSSSLAHSVMAQLEELVRAYARRQQLKTQKSSCNDVEVSLLGVLNATRALIFRASNAVQTQNPTAPAADVASIATEVAAPVPFFDRVGQLRAEHEQLEQALQTQRADIEQVAAQIAAKAEEVRSVRASATQDEFGLNVEMRKTNKLGLKVQGKEKVGEAVEAERIRLESQLKGVRKKAQQLQAEIQSSTELLRSEQKMQKALERRQIRRANKATAVPDS